jgi:pseudouridine synthase
VRIAGNGVRKTLDRLISRSGAGSRTEARRWIAEGRVRVNGRLTREPDTWVDPAADRVTLDGKRLESAEPTYVLLYKPKGCVTTYRDPQGRPTVYDLIKDVGQFVGTVGRLDLDSSGLLLLTNDHDLADRLTNPAYHIEKEYLVKAASVLSDEQLEHLCSGVTLSDGPTRPAMVVRERDGGRHTFVRITITEGRNRQVRRMLEAVGSGVLKLVRVRLGPLRLGNLAIGKYRLLEPVEIKELKRHVGQQSSGQLPVPPRHRTVLSGRSRRAGLRD